MTGEVMLLSGTLIDEGVLKVCENTMLRIFYPKTKNKETNSVAFSPQANYSGVSRGQGGGSTMVVNLSFLDRSHDFSFK
jgi:hypothetical protein